MTPILSMLMGMLNARNPKMYQSINMAMNNGQNPQELLKQVMGNATPEQREGIIKQAGSMGCPKEILSQIQNMK